MKQPREIPTSPTIHTFLLRHPRFGQIALDACRRGEESAEADSKVPFRSVVHRGLRAVQQSIHYLGVDLLALREGFAEEDKNGFQPRILDHSGPSRVLLCRGGKDFGDGFNVNEKGGLSRRLIEDNALTVGRTLFPKAHGLIVNLWVLTELKDKRLYVFLVLPVSLSKEGTSIAAAEWSSIGECDLGESTITVSSPPPPPVDFDVEERNAATP